MFSCGPWAVFLLKVRGNKPSHFLFVAVAFMFLLVGQTYSGSGDNARKGRFPAMATEEEDTEAVSE